MQQLPETSSAHQNLENGISKKEVCFDESLRELKDLRTQLHFAADSCETIFLKSQEKRDVVENTKEYICRAVVTLVDHLGNVSAKLDHFISDPNHFSDVELRIHCLKQRIMCSQQYAQNLALSKLRWRENLPTHQRRYLSTAALNNIEKKSSEEPRDINSTKPTEQKMYSSASTDEALQSFRNVFATGMGIRDELSSLPSNAPNSTFHFQMVSSERGRRRSLSRKSSSPMLLGSEVLSLLRRVKKSNAKL